MTREIRSVASLHRGVTPLLALLLASIIGCDTQQAADTQKTTTPPKVKPIEQTAHSTESARVRGIDISNYQGDVDWVKVKASGIGFAYMQASQGIHFIDPNFADNTAAIKKTGLPYGSYHFFRPNHDADAQAQLFLKTTKGRIGELPPMLDIEVSAGLSAEKVGAGAKRWLEVVEQAIGCKPLVYSYGSFWETNLKDSVGDYPLWLAEYAAKPRLPAGKDHWSLWQYSEKGKVDGIKGPVDLNYFNGDAKALENLRCNKEGRT